MSAERQVLTAPDVVARAAAAVAPDREQRWILRQPRAVRCSYADEVLGRHDEDVRAEAWMLRQPRALRLSYLDEVAAHQPGVPPEQRWMLRQDDEVCRSYVREVLGDP